MVYDDRLLLVSFDSSTTYASVQEFAQQRNVPNISLLSVLPAVETTAPRFLGYSYEIQRIQIVRSACNELLEVIRLITHYYSASVALFVVQSLQGFCVAAILCNKFNNKNTLLILVSSLPIILFHLCLIFLCCTLLEMEIQSVKLNLNKAISLTKNRNSRNQLKYVYCRLIHENKGISCGFFDFNFNLITPIIDLATTLLFALLPKL